MYKLFIAHGASTNPSGFKCPPIVSGKLQHNGSAPVGGPWVLCIVLYCIVDSVVYGKRPHWRRKRVDIMRLARSNDPWNVLTSTSFYRRRHRGSPPVDRLRTGSDEGINGGGRSPEFLTWAVPLLLLLLLLLRQRRWRQTACSTTHGDGGNIKINTSTF